MVSRRCGFTLVLLTALASVLIVTAAPRAAGAQTAEVRYERAMARERDVRDQASPSISTLRSIATAYEMIVRRYPRSGYCDNALWQAAGLLQLAWELDGQERDRDKALSLLTWLRREYPSSSLIRQIGVRATALREPRATAVRARAASPRAESPRAESAEAEPTDEPRRAAASTTTGAKTEEARVVPRPAPFPGAPAPATARSRPAETEAPSEDRGGMPVVVRGMSHTRLPHGERLTFELSRETTFHAAAGSEGFTLTLADAEAAAAIVDAARRIGGEVIGSVQLENADDGLRVRVAVKGEPRQSGFLLYGPDRVVFDFETPGRPDPGHAAPVRRAAAGGPPASVPATPAVTPVEAAAPPVEIAPIEPASEIAGGYSLARQLGLGVSRVVIDPGHGGTDPGAQANGVTEAHVVLDIALRLEKLLQAQPGFEVVLTRRTNTAVALDRRTEIANEQAADLFVSIHANSSSRRQTAGVETYFLNLATDPEAEALAARENAASAQAMHTLPELVRAITTNNKIAESRELASMVQSSLVGRLQPRNDDFQDLGVKQAPFVVLIGAQMPSVLAEVAFLTNRAEARMLGQDAYRQEIAQALADAILQYRASLKKADIVTASTGQR